MGWSHDTNLAVIRAFKEGILTSASVMVPGQYFDEAVELCKANPGLAVGLHIVLVEYEPLRPILAPEEIPSLVTPSGFFHLSMADFDRAEPRVEDIEKEVRAQIGKARAVGLQFVYLDCHNLWQKMVIGGYRPDILNLLIGIAKQERLLAPLYEEETSMNVDVIKWSRPPHYSADSPQFVENAEFLEEGKIKFFQDLRDLGSGRWLAVFHPGLYRPAHNRELKEIVCAAETKQIIRKRGIRLISYQDLWNRKYGEP
jgi:predicted glycoside hydrolase/deacetylase ChbG (UPF0249 family)